MELWIRVQKNKKLKQGLVKAEDLIVDEYSDGEWCIYQSCDTLGIYKTEKRALKILDEIEKILHPFVYLDNCIITGSSNGMIYRDKKTNQLIEFSTYVYEMPEE